MSDLHWVADTLNTLSQRILENPYISEERDYRLASLLEERARLLFPRITSQRIYEFDEVIAQIKNAFIQVDSPWKQTLNLKNFNDSYNAQTLSPWFVPSLLVDDDDKWISEISSKGPQVITGVRGCGKTMLLRALQFHARAMPRTREEKNSSQKITDRLKNEGYIGLYVSCTRLLDKLGDQDLPLHEPFSKLFIAYALEAIHAIRHLRELDRKTIEKIAFKEIAEIISEYVENTADLKNADSEYEVEKNLKTILNSLSKGEKKYTIKANPANTFLQLANVIRTSSRIWNNHYVFFLLDDVSTRFLNDQNIITLVSSLLFQNENCSFKFTTEAQTLEMVIHSPGNIEQARIGRDYTIFDLGHEVNEKVHSNNKGGIEFVEKILLKRSQFHSSHPKNLRPSELLGDATLQSIAESIAKKAKASEKKGLYHGITAIAGVCVGDIGDVITLYEMILNKRKTVIPISAIDQNESYLQLCHSRLFDINRRESRLFDFAESFSETSHHLLVQSYNLSKGKSKKRLRQYSSIFINITTGDIPKQYKQVRELIDAGIFNFSGGPKASRTNRQGLNPQQQFKLTFRKLYGLHKHIGLAQSDRFELSAEPLEEWLNNPKKGKDILIRNLKSMLEEDVEVDGLDSNARKKRYVTNKSIVQKSLFEDSLKTEKNNNSSDVKIIEALAKAKTPKAKQLNLLTLKKQGISTFFSSYGFEKNVVQSFKRLLSIPIKEITLVRFPNKGRELEINKLLYNFSRVPKVITYQKAISGNFPLPKDSLVDITGLPQGIIFNAIRNSLNEFNKIKFVYTDAETYYPLNVDIEILLKKFRQKDQTQFLESLSHILKGETGPYKAIPLLPKEINHAARRVLIAFASAKHERLYSLLDEREYDKIHIIVPYENDPRGKLAKISAEVAVRKFNHAEISKIQTDNLQEVMEYLSLQYQNYFINQNFCFEIAITGSKLQTVAAAAICSSYKVNQCWYIQPTKWDEKRFTKGYGKTRFYEINKLN
ncbi:MAG: hypothetical protein WAT19_05735 [Ferruginibacter sp.]